MGRTARREARKLWNEMSAELATARKTARAMVKRMAAIEKELAALQQAVAKAPAVALSATKPAVRFSPRTVSTLRSRLGLSAEQLGRLLGVSSQAVYFWEQGVVRPRQATLELLVSMRVMGRRAALEELARRSRSRRATSPS